MDDKILHKHDVEREKNGRPFKLSGWEKNQ